MAAEAPRWRVAFVVDARAEAGLGHVMRCRSLARALREEGAAVAFFPGAPSEAALQRLAEFEVLPGDPAALLPSWKPEQIVLDHYGLQGDAFPALRRAGTRLLALDDAPRRPWRVDWLLDPAASPEDIEAYRALLPPGAQVLAGGRFALVDSAYGQAAVPEPTSSARPRVLVAMGGTDPAGATAAALEALRAHRQAVGTIDVVLGPAYPDPEALVPLAGALDAHLHFSPPSLLPWLAQADLMLGAGGSTHWERAAVGVPAAVVTLAPNQRLLTARLAADGAVVDVGEAPGCWEAAVGLLATNASFRAALRTRLRTWTDGRGARRIALLMRNARLNVRPAQLSDARLMFEWRNATATRRFSRDASPLCWDDHLAWVTRSLPNPDRRLFVGELDGRPCGILRYDRGGEGVEVSIYLDPARHGESLGPALLQAGERAILSHWPATRRIDAFILAENHASEHAFATAGFTRRFGVWSHEEPSA